MDRKHQWRSGCLIEIEVAGEIAQRRVSLAAIGTRVGTIVGGEIEALPAEEIVLDELQVRVVTEKLVVDVALLGIRTGHDFRHSQAIAVLVNDRRFNVVVETAPVVP